jgi:hypothetical protein
MSQANLDLVRSICAAWERGDFSSAAWANPEIKFAMSAGGTADGEWTGLAGISEGLRGYLSAWKDYRVKVDDIREIDDKRVLTLTEYSGVGKESGLDLRATPMLGAILFELRDGTVTQLTAYGSREGALADLGLAHEGDSER